MVDNHKKRTRNELDGLVYDKLSVNLFLDGKSLKFSFQIKNYHEIMRYKMIVMKEEGKLKVKVTDADYLFKKALYQTK